MHSQLVAVASAGRLASGSLSARQAWWGMAGFMDVRSLLFRFRNVMPRRMSLVVSPLPARAPVLRKEVPVLTPRARGFLKVVRLH